MSRGKSIKNWPKDDRPREKLLKDGEHTLSTAELLAILLRTGSRGQSALDLARGILGRFGTLRNMSHTCDTAWGEFKGLGAAKLAQIRAAIEIGRRLHEEPASGSTPVVSSSKDAFALVGSRLRDLKKEVFKVILLNNKNRVIEIVEAAAGTVNEAYPIQREIFAQALQRFAASVVCAHNHPSGECRPSAEDFAFTRELVKAGDVLRVRVLDHIIIGDDCYYSFKDNGAI